MNQSNLERRVEVLARQGVHIVDPRQVYIAPDVDLSRIAEGVILYPGTRLQGAKTWLGPGVHVGTEGPATVIDSVFDEASLVASGYVKGAVLLKKSALGANAHVRPGTLLEEEASTAHAVGLKHTLLLSFVTLGSLINFCDCLMVGGTSRKDHAEVGSGYIHFNFTPWGKSGDKATPSLIGDVPRGVFLRERRIFLGGTGGLVGPSTIGFGAVAGAGQVVRSGIEEGYLVIQAPRSLSRVVELSRLDPVFPRASKNIRYIANLVALKAWYEKVRLPSIPMARKPVIEAAIVLLDDCIEERVKQLNRFLEERSAPLLAFPRPTPLPCPLQPPEEVLDHVSWVQSLSEEDVAKGVTWLETLVDQVVSTAEEALDSLGASS